jgi:hypothetical protein
LFIIISFLFSLCYYYYYFLFYYYYFIFLLFIYFFSFFFLLGGGGGMVILQKGGISSNLGFFSVPKGLPRQSPSAKWIRLEIRSKTPVSKSKYLSYELNANLKTAKMVS